MLQTFGRGFFTNIICLGRWDVFPGIKLADPRYLATPFHKGNLADPRHLGFIATPFRQGRFADPRQLISPFRRKSKSKATQAWVSNDRMAEKTSDSATTTSSTDSDDKDDKEAISSPNGPLSVQMSSMTSRSDTMDQDMEMRLTKTFGHDQLAALEYVLFQLPSSFPPLKHSRCPM